VGSDAAESPESGVVVMILPFDVVKDLIVAQDFLVLITINRNTKLVSNLVFGKIILLLLDRFNNTGSMTLSVLLFFHQKSTPNNL